MTAKRKTKSGNILEKTVKAVLTGNGFTVINYREWSKNPSEFGEELLLTNVPFETIYQHHGSTEFLLKSKEFNLEIRIECKWQQVSGSVDEKLPYLYLNTIETMPEKHIVILIDGDGWKPGAIPWLKEAVSKKKYTTQNMPDKKIEVLNLKEFITWANILFK